MCVADFANQFSNDTLQVSAPSRAIKLITLQPQQRTQRRGRVRRNMCHNSSW